MHDLSDVSNGETAKKRRLFAGGIIIALILTGV